MHGYSGRILNVDLSRQQADIETFDEAFAQTYLGGNGFAIRLLYDRLAPGTAVEEVGRAQQAFAERAYMIVIDEQPIWDPDAVVTLAPQSRVEFIKILPLIGG